MSLHLDSKAMLFLGGVLFKPRAVVAIILLLAACATTPPSPPAPLRVTWNMEHLSEDGAQAARRALTQTTR